MALLHRLFREDHARISYAVDGVACEGRAGDTVLTALLTAGDALRNSEFKQAPRAGFCQMGACQDCWVTLEDGRRLRACTTPLRAGMRLVTGRRA